MLGRGCLGSGYKIEIQAEIIGVLMILSKEVSQGAQVQPFSPSTDTTNIISLITWKRAFPSSAKPCVMRRNWALELYSSEFESWHSHLLVMPP